MDTLLSHDTALQAIRTAALSRRLERDERASVAVPELPPTRGEALELLGLVPELSAPLHVTVTSGSRVGPSGLVVAHVTRLALPPDSAVPVAPGVSCVSPEHLIVQMAPALTLVELVYLLGELLGTYALGPGGQTLPRNRPVTTRGRVLDHLSALGPVPWTAHVRRALTMACEGSASPAETRLSMRLGLKPALGGYHLNVLAAFGPRGRALVEGPLGAGERRPDVLLGACAGAPCSGVALDLAEEGRGSPRSLAVRRREMLAAGLGHHVLTEDLVEDVGRMDELVCGVRAELGLPSQRLTRGEAARRRALRQRLRDDLARIGGASQEGRPDGDARSPHGEGASLGA